MRYTPIYIDGQPWAVCLPTGSSKEGVPNDWDVRADFIGENNDLFHYKSMYSWCCDISDENTSSRATRGYYSARFWGYYPAANQDALVGFRPDLIPLNPDTLMPDPDRLMSIPNGTVLTFGALYMGEEPLKVPQNPVWNGDIPDYQCGAPLRIGDTPADPAQQISWVKFGDRLFADRNLLKNISWNDLHSQGLVFGLGPENVLSQLSKDLRDDNYRREFYLNMDENIRDAAIDFEETSAHKYQHLIPNYINGSKEYQNTIDEAFAAITGRSFVSFLKSAAEIVNEFTPVEKQTPARSFEAVIEEAKSRAAAQQATANLQSPDLKKAETGINKNGV